MPATTVKQLNAELTARIDQLTAENAALREQVNSIDLILTSLIHDNTGFLAFQQDITARIARQDALKKQNNPAPQQPAKNDPPFKPTATQQQQAPAAKNKSIRSLLNPANKSAKPADTKTAITSMAQYKEYIEALKLVAKNTGKSVTAINYATAQNMPLAKLMASLK